MSGQDRPELSPTQAELSGMLDHIPIAAILLDSDLRVRRTNRAFLDLAKRRADEVAADRYGDVLRCVHASDDPRGCGFGSTCETCTVHRCLLETTDSGLQHRDVTATLTLLRGDREFETDLIVSTARVALAHGPRVVLCLQHLPAPQRPPDSTRSVEASLAEAQRIARLGNWDWNILNNDLWWSDEIYRIFGLAPREFGATYEAFLATVHPDDRNAVQEGVRRALEEEHPYNLDHRIVLPDGSKKVVHEQAEVFRDETGRPIRMIGTVQDITERKNLERIVSQRQEALESIYRIATTVEPSLTAVCNRIVASLADLLQTPHAVARAVEDNEIAAFAWMADGKLHYEGSPEVICGPCGAVLQSQEACRFAGDLRQRFPGSPCFSRQELRAYLGVPVRGASREASGVLCVMDYAERSFDQEEVRLLEIFARYLAYEIEHERMDIQLQRAQRMELLGRLASGVAHEVRNPLNAILAISEALHEDLRDDPEHGEYLAHIRTQVDRLTRLMQELLDLGKPVRASDMRSESLPALCSAAIDLWEQTAAHPRHRARMAPPRGGANLEVLCDGAKIQQVLLNLLDNAAEHSPPGHDIALTISESSGGGAQVQVRDRGSGIPSTEISRVFEPFFTTRKGGTGLGLSIVRHIIETHGGKVMAVNNDPPPGCTIAFSLPRGSQ